MVLLLSYSCPTLLPVFICFELGLHLLAFGLVLRVLFVLLEGLQDLFRLFLVHFRLVLRLLVPVVLLVLLLLLLLLLILLILLLPLILIVRP